MQPSCCLTHAISTFAKHCCYDYDVIHYFAKAPSTGSPDSHCLSQFYLAVFEKL